MKFDEKAASYLKDEAFSSSLYVPISGNERHVPDRLGIIEGLATGKNIIHLGCADHLSLISKKIENNIWLHGRLRNCAKRCLGIDINREGIEYLRDRIGINDLVCADLLNDEVDEIKGNKWDYMVIGEVLEHLDNPELFLSNLRKKFKANIGKLIITVPNAFFWLNFRNALAHRENINSQHYYWFSPYTLAKIIISSGMTPEDFRFCEPIPVRNDYKARLNIRLLIGKFLLKRFPALRETLVMVASL